MAIQFCSAQFPVTYKSPGNFIGFPHRVTVDYDSGILVTGSSRIDNNRLGAEIIKFDANGKKLWIRDFITEVLNNNISIKQSKFGGYYIFGTTYLYDTLGDAFFCKLNPCAELEWGEILKIPEWNYINDVFETNDNELLITQCGNAFRDKQLLFTHIGLFNLNSKSYSKQFLIPIHPLNKKIVNFNSKFYAFNTWYFQDSINQNNYKLGSSQISFDSSLSKFQIKYFKPYSIPNTFPIITAAPVFLESGNCISGGSLSNIRANLYYPMSFAKFDKNLKLIEYKDMGHIRNQYSVEHVEDIFRVNPQQMLITLNYQPDGDYPISFNSRSEFYLVDTNFSELKKVTYGDTLNYRYYIHDAIKNYDSNVLVLMHKFASYNDIAYEIVKFNKNLELSNYLAPSKLYDYKCAGSVDTAGKLNLSGLDTLTMTNWNVIAHSSNLKEHSNQDNIFKVYPNPSSGHINIVFNSPQTGSIKVYNEIGQLLFQMYFISTSQFNFELPDSINKIIYLKVETEDINALKLILKN